MPDTWLRLPEESEPAYVAFLTYRDLGEARNVLDAFRRSEGKPGAKQATGRWNRWVKINRWYDRVRDWDNHNAAQRQAGLDRRAQAEGGEWERRRSQQVRDDYDLAQQLLRQARLIARFPVSQQKTTKDGRTVIVEPVEPRHLKDAAAIARDASAMAWEAIGRGLGTPEEGAAADPGRAEMDAAIGRVYGDGTGDDPCPGLTAADLGIATLDLAMAATSLVAPVTTWGSARRSARMPGTYHFYTDDYRFAALTRRPGMVPRSGCAAAVEPNYSTQPGAPLCRVLHDVWWKRRVACRWQHAGVRVIVDLNVEPEFREYNLLGVPDGWPSYAVRSQDGIGWDVVEADFAAASGRCGCNPGLFVVFGGGKRARAYCERRGWAHVPEHMHVAEGRGVADG